MNPEFSGLRRLFLQHASASFLMFLTKVSEFRRIAQFLYARYADDSTST